MCQVIAGLFQTQHKLLQKVDGRSRKPVEQQVHFSRVGEHGEGELLQLVGGNERVFTEVGQDAGGVEVVAEVGVVLSEYPLVGRFLASHRLRICTRCRIDIQWNL